MLFHAHVGLHIDDFKESQLDGLLNLWFKIIPDIGVSGWSEVGEAESKLGGSKISRLGRVGSWIEKGITFEDIEIGGDKLVGFLVPEGEKQSFGVFAEVGVIGLQDISDNLDELCRITHVEVDIIIVGQQSLKSHLNIICIV